jgi:hypothetical protein
MRKLARTPNAGPTAKLRHLGSRRVRERRSRIIEDGATPSTANLDRSAHVLAEAQLATAISRFNRPRRALRKSTSPAVGN